MSQTNVNIYKTFVSKLRMATDHHQRAEILETTSGRAEALFPAAKWEDLRSAGMTKALLDLVVVEECVVRKEGTNVSTRLPLQAVEPFTTCIPASASVNSMPVLWPSNTLQQT